jgi:hypothetical protein
MNKELRYRVVYGYNPSDYISIKEDYLEKAKYSMLSGGLLNYQNQTVRGSEIKRIEPDFRFYTGWLDSYNPKESEDYAQIERDVPRLLLEERSRIADNRVRYILQHNKPALLNDINNVDKLLLG